MSNKKIEKTVVDNSDEVNYKKLKSLFFNLYELKSEKNMFDIDDIVIDIEIKEYIDTLNNRIKELENKIKTILTTWQ